MKKDRDLLDIEEGGITFTDLEMDVPDEESMPDQEEYYGRKGKKKKKKRKKKRYLLKFFILVLVLVGIFFLLRSDFFNIDNINVNNNEHYTKEQIVELADVKIGDNLFEFTIHGMKKKLTKDPYIESVKISRKIPHTLELTVNERKESIVVPYGEKFIVSDYEGMVLRIADKAPDLTVVNNLEPEKPVPGKALEVKETQILTDTLSMLKEVEKVDLYFKKISVSRHSVRAYIYDTLLVEGSYDSISENLANLSIVVEDLHKKKIKRGTIREVGNGDWSFLPEIDDKKS